MRSFVAATCAAACFLLCACSEGLYSATAAGDGNVVIVNRMTGDARSVHGGTMVDVRTASIPASAGVRYLTARSVPKQPISVGGTAKYRDGSMLVRVSIAPANAKMSDDERPMWRNHVKLLEDSAVLRLHFLDADGFEVASENLALSAMPYVADEQGRFEGLASQVTVHMTQQNYEAVRDWSVGWSGFWPDYFYLPPEPSESQKTTPKPKT